MNDASLDLETHVAIWGMTSSGKTTFFRRKIYDPTTGSKKRVVYVNPQRAAGFGPAVTDWRVDLLTQPRSRVNIVLPPMSSNEDYERAVHAQLGRIVDDLFLVGRKLPNPERRIHVVLAVDEVQLAAPKHGTRGNPLKLVATNGLAHGISLVVIGQRPALVDHTLLTQCPTHILFELEAGEKGYLDDYGVPQEVRDWISTPLPGAGGDEPNRRFAIRKRKTWTLCNPI